MRDIQVSLGEVFTGVAYPQFVEQAGEGLACFFADIMPKCPNRRCGCYTMRYFSLDMKLDETHPSNKEHKIYYYRGENTANNLLVYL